MQRNLRSVLSMACAAALAAGCNDNASQNRDSDAQKRVHDSADPLGIEKGPLPKELEARMAQLERTLSAVQWVLREKLEPKKAVVDATSKGYTFLESSVGILVVSCDGAQPYLDGYKVSLEVGNPLNVTFAGFRLKVRSGKAPPTADIFDQLVPSGASEQASN